MFISLFEYAWMIIFRLSTIRIVLNTVYIQLYVQLCLIIHLFEYFIPVMLPCMASWLTSRVVPLCLVRLVFYSNTCSVPSCQPQGHEPSSPFRVYHRVEGGANPFSNGVSESPITRMVRAKIWRLTTGHHSRWAPRVLGCNDMMSCKGAEDTVFVSASGDDAHITPSHHDNESETNTTRFAGCVTLVLTIVVVVCDVCVCIITTGWGKGCLLGDVKK